tara:strand:- start:4220 stop:4669 length:450 start_codon:yes stop_codon:yes gene_type:complete
MNSNDYRHQLNPFLVGADRLWEHMDQIQSYTSSNSNYPPYNIIKVNDYDYCIELAVAGYKDNEIKIDLKDRELTIVGKKIEADGKNYLHKGIANRTFTRLFSLSDTVEVQGADQVDGVLSIHLENVIPENKKPRSIKISGRDKREFLKE